MKPAWWMVGAALGSWLAVAAVPGMESDVEVLFGMDVCIRALDDVPQFADVAFPFT